MRRVVFASVVGLSALLALTACQKKSAETAKTGEGAPVTATAAAPAGPITPPHRKPGLWAQTMTTAGMHQTTKICLDADTEAKLTLWGQAVGKDMCKRNVITPTAGGWAIESECDLGAGGHVVSKGVATGDFNSAYTMKVSSTTTGAQMAQANGTHEMQLDAKYEGPCPAGMKGGDVHMDIPGMKGGMTINLEQMAAKK